LNGQAPAFGGAAARATTPTVDVNSLRAQQGTCSDITGVGGSAPINCSPSGNAIPQALQMQIARAQSLTQVPDPSRDALQSAADQYRKLELEFQAAGDVVNAAIAAEEAFDMEVALGSASRTCPTQAPRSYWSKLKDYADYCENANCAERGTAYYGMICFPDYKQSRSAEERVQYCKNRFAMLSAENLGTDDFSRQMKAGDVRCKPDGTPSPYRGKVEGWWNRK
jgi:hypothetical protein